MHFFKLHLTLCCAVCIWAVTKAHTEPTLCLSQANSVFHTSSKKCVTVLHLVCRNCLFALSNCLFPIQGAEDACSWELYRGNVDGYSHLHTMKLKSNICDKYLLLNQNCPSLWARLWTLQTFLLRVLCISWGYVSTQSFYALSWCSEKKEGHILAHSHLHDLNTKCPGAGGG